MDINEIRQDHDLISPTAKLVAYSRGMTNIPYADQISALVGARQVSQDLLGESFERMIPFMNVMIEGRYKGIDSEISKLGAKNILEIAAGVLPRGLIFTANPENRYVATDLEDILGENQRVITELMGRNKIPPRNNLSFQPVNVLNYQALERAARIFGGEQFVISCEGLIPYLEPQERKLFFSHVQRLSHDLGAVLITSDMMDQTLRKESMSQFNDNQRACFKIALGRIQQATGRSIYFYDSPEQLKQEMEESNLQCTLVFPQNVDQLSCLNLVASDQIPALIHCAKYRPTAIISAK